MEIFNHTTAGQDRDPFSQSDRDPIGRCAGKGDRNRSITKRFADRFPETMGPKGPRKSGKTTYRY